MNTVRVMSTPSDTSCKLFTTDDIRHLLVTFNEEHIIYNAKLSTFGRRIGISYSDSCKLNIEISYLDIRNHYFDTGLPSNYRSFWRWFIDTYNLQVNDIEHTRTTKATQDIGTTTTLNTDNTEHSVKANEEKNMQLTVLEKNTLLSDALEYAKVSGKITKEEYKALLKVESDNVRQQLLNDKIKVYELEQEQERVKSFKEERKNNEKQALKSTRKFLATLVVATVSLLIISPFLYNYIKTIPFFDALGSAVVFTTLSLIIFGVCIVGFIYYQLQVAKHNVENSLTRDLGYGITLGNITSWILIIGFGIAIGRFLW